MTAEVLDRLERPDEAAELAEQELERARVWAAPGAIGRALQGRRDRAARRGPRSAARGGRGARGLADDASSWRRRCTRLAWRRGSAASRPRPASRCSGRSSWRAAAARPCSPSALARSCAPAASRPRREALTGAGALTPSERRVADLAAVRADQPRDRPGALRDPEDRRGPPLQRYRKLEIPGRRELGAALPLEPPEGARDRAAPRDTEVQGGDCPCDCSSARASSRPCGRSSTASSGPGARLMLIEGQAGIGKSTLLAEAQPAGGRRRDPDARSLADRCSSASSRSGSCASCSSPSSPIRDGARAAARRGRGARRRRVRGGRRASPAATRRSRRCTASTG